MACAVTWCSVVGAQTQDGAIARVGRLDVPETDFVQRVESAISGYEQRTGQPVPDAFEPMLRRHVLERLIPSPFIVCYVAV